MYSSDINSFISDYNFDRSRMTDMLNSIDELKAENARLTKLVAQYKLKNYLAIVGVTIVVTAGMVLFLI